MGEQTNTDKMKPYIQKSYRPIITLRGAFWLTYTLLILTLLILLLL